MSQFRVGYDDNLGIPADFAATIDCEVVSFHDLGEMLNAFELDQLTAIFIPAGTLPYLENYAILSEALLPSGKSKLQSNFVTTGSITINDISRYTIGRVNKYCTTSFWSPLIYLMNFLPKATQLNFQQANTFQDMLHKTAQQIIDCSMVWDVIMQKNPADAQRVHELFMKNDLPPPLIIAKANDADLQKKLNVFKSADPNAMFTRFQSPDLNAIEKFLADIKAAQAHFTIKEVTGSSRQGAK